MIIVEFENSSCLSPACSIVKLMEYPMIIPLRSPRGGAFQVKTADVAARLMTLNITGPLLGTMDRTLLKSMHKCESGCNS